LITGFQLGSYGATYVALISASMSVPKFAVLSFLIMGVNKLAASPAYTVLKPKGSAVFCPYIE